MNLIRSSLFIYACVSVLCADTKFSFAVNNAAGVTPITPVYAYNGNDTGGVGLYGEAAVYNAPNGPSISPLFTIPSFTHTGVTSDGTPTTVDNWIVGAYYTSTGAMLVGNSYEATGDTSFIDGSVTPGTTITDGGTMTNIPVVAGSRQVNPDLSKTLWVNTDTTLTADLFREGIDKAVAFTGIANPNTSSGGGTGGTVTISGTVLLDPSNEVEKLSHQQNQLFHDSEYSTIPTSSEMASAGASARDAIAALYPTAPTGLGYTLDTSGAPMFSGGILAITMPSRFGGATIDFNPFETGRLSGVASWFRAAMVWLVLVHFGIWVWKQIAEWTRGFSTVKQATGNAIAAGSGAQATAFAAAAIITTAIVAATTALLAFEFDTISIPALVANSTTNPLATIPAGVLWMVDQLIPCVTVLTCVVARLTFNLYAATIFAGVTAVIRFVVP